MEICKAFGDPTKAKAWSKHSQKSATDKLSANPNPALTDSKKVPRLTKSFLLVVFEQLLTALIFLILQFREFSKAKAFSFYFQKKKQIKETNNALVNVSKHLCQNSV